MKLADLVLLEHCSPRVFADVKNALERNAKLERVAEAARAIRDHDDADIQDLANYGLWEPLLSALKELDEGAG